MTSAKSMDNRKQTRYVQIGRVDIPELCTISGILDDISLTGIKMHFPYTISLDLENEYKIKVTLSNFLEEEPLQLLCKPVWVRDDENETQIGFQNLYSPDEVHLKKIILNLKHLNDFPEIK